MAIPTELPLLHFPLAGEWSAPNTPAHRVPSHGTDFLGQRFAYDFVRVGDSRWRPFGAPLLAHAFGAVRTSAFAAWETPVEAACDGTVVTAADGWPDRVRRNLYVDLWQLMVAHRFRPVRISPQDWRPLTGNYLLVDTAVGVLLYAHLRNGSLRVRAGDRVKTGDPLGLVGDSGRSSMPHLHFHLMDRADDVGAMGLPCGFRNLERWNGSAWEAAPAVPTRGTRLRRVE